MRAQGLILLIAALAARPACAQLAPPINPHANSPAVEVELEGALDMIAESNGVHRITVVHVPVRVDDDTRIFSPTAEISRWDLLGSPFPGRATPGFLNGTAIVIGSSIEGRIHADVLLVEPAETVLAGPATDPHTLGPSIVKIRIVMLADPRMPGKALNELGFQIDPLTIAPGTFAVAEGYMGDDRVFYAHTVMANGDIVGPANQTTIVRTRCTPAGELDIRGGSTTPNGSAKLFDADTGDLLDEVPIEPDEDLAGLGAYRFNLTVGSCPEHVRVENSNGSSAEADVEMF